MSGTLIPMNANNGNETDIEMRKGPWTFEEDNILIHYIACHGQGKWNTLAKYSGLKRSGKSCRLRWLNYLRPDIKHGSLNIQEQLLILELHSKFGNRWSKIAQYLPGRTDNEIKNYWRTRVQKQARQLKVDSNSKRFLEAIRYFWMPRLIEQMEQNVSPQLSTSSCSTSAKLEIQGPSTFSPFQPNIKLDILDQYYENTISVTNSIPGKLTNTNYLYHNSAYMDGSGDDHMEGFHLDAASSVDIRDGLLSDSQMAGSDWVHDDMASIVWDINELW